MSQYSFFSSFLSFFFSLHSPRNPFFFSLFLFFSFLCFLSKPVTATTSWTTAGVPFPTRAGAVASLIGDDENPKVWWPSEQGRAYTATPKFRHRNFEVTFRPTPTTVRRVGGTVGINIVRGSWPTKSFQSTHHFSPARFWVSSPLWKHFPATPEVIWVKDLYFRDVLIRMIVLIHAMHIFVDVSGTATNRYCAPLGKNVILRSD
ncbi:uncharacterized protein LOC133788676 [Humulus lupulus]|uniref:uncharacterized protein LOC133788676 n=1 Tax=Humulus lupulus TaxID=3486 RepID=UPI002B410D91|nr:uncharacterized protein LOC133788676 [Humulus lupulus]